MKHHDVVQNTVSPFQVSQQRPRKAKLCLVTPQEIPYKLGRGPITLIEKEKRATKNRLDRGKSRKGGKGGERAGLLLKFKKIPGGVAQ